MLTDVQNFIEGVLSRVLESGGCAGMQAYDGMMFREALKAGWYDAQKARDTYRSFVQEEGMHKDLALRYAEVPQMRPQPLPRNPVTRYMKS